MRALRAVAEDGILDFDKVAHAAAFAHDRAAQTRKRSHRAPRADARVRKVRHNDFCAALYAAVGDVRALHRRARFYDGVPLDFAKRKNFRPRGNAHGVVDDGVCGVENENPRFQQSVGYSLFQLIIHQTDVFCTINFDEVRRGNEIAASAPFAADYLRSRRRSAERKHS